MSKGVSGAVGRSIKQHWETDSHIPFRYTARFSLKSLNFHEKYQPKLKVDTVKKESCLQRRFSLPIQNSQIFKNIFNTVQVIYNKIHSNS